MKALARAVIGIAGVALVAMAGIQAWQVFARYVLNDPPSWTEPLALLCMSTTMMFGAAAGVHAGRHFGFFIVVEHARPQVRRLMQLVARLIATAVGVLGTPLGGCERACLTLEIVEQREGLVLPTHGPHLITSCLWKAC